MLYVFLTNQSIYFFQWASLTFLCLSHEVKEFYINCGCTMGVLFQYCPVLLFHVGILKLPQSMCNDQNLSQTTQQSKCQERQLSSFEASRNIV